MRQSRREFVRQAAVFATWLAAIHRSEGAARRKPKVAAIVTIYTHNSHADVLISRILQSHTLDGLGGWPAEGWPALELASLYVDQMAPKDKSRELAAKHQVPIAASIREALTLGGDKLAVDGVLLIGEHGDYPLSVTGQIMYPRHRFFMETAAVFRKSRRAVPVFQDKHLSWSWTEAKEIYDTARSLKAPLMAGSSVPGSWRHPPLELRRGTRLKEVLALSYGPLEAYAFHGLECLQSIVERRRGGESGVANVEFVQGRAVWDAMAAGRFAEPLLRAALGRIKRQDRLNKPIQEALKKPAACFIEYQDGLRATMIHDEGDLLGEWVVAWQDSNSISATTFWTQEERPLGHFAFLLQGIERMVHTRKPTWPVERTLLTTGILAAWFDSRQRQGARLPTPHLEIKYKPTWTWTEPPAPPPGRPFTVQ